MFNKWFVLSGSSNFRRSNLLMLGCTIQLVGKYLRPTLSLAGFKKKSQDKDNNTTEST